MRMPDVGEHAASHPAWKEAADRIRTTKAFTTWTKGGVRFIAFPYGDGVMVVDENGVGYGTWRTEESFRSGKIEAVPLYSMALEVRRI